jgi:hypothetical protein
LILRDDRVQIGTTAEVAVVDDDVDDDVLEAASDVGAKDDVEPVVEVPVVEVPVVEVPVVEVAELVAGTAREQPPKPTMRTTNRVAVRRRRAPSR